MRTATTFGAHQKYKWCAPEVQMVRTKVPFGAHQTPCRQSGFSERERHVHAAPADLILPLTHVVKMAQGVARDPRVVDLRTE